MSAPSQHSGLSGTRWAEFSYDQQILMIANELHRTARLIDLGAWDRARTGLERTLRLTDLTVSCVTSPTRRRELLRWRDLAADLYLQSRPDADTHKQVFLCLLQFTPTSFEQTPTLFNDHHGGTTDLQLG